MLDWLFSPSCPCDHAAKTWVEERLQWLAAEFPDHAFNGRRIVLPTEAFFPDVYDGTKRAALDLVEQVCVYMDVDPSAVEVQFMTMKHDPNTWLVNQEGHYLPPGAAGTYEETTDGYRITLETSALSEPMDLVGTIAHELAHVRTIGEGRATSDEYDNELLTDLTVIHFGLGIFLANTPRHWEGSSTRWPGTKLRKPEYMSPPMFGWALAHLAWFRGETKPTWAEHLTDSARSNLREGIRYLNATKDSSYKPLRYRGDTI